jgi:hypothetical protein
MVTTTTVENYAKSLRSVEVEMLVAEVTGEHRGVMSTISRTDAMSEYQRD